MTAGEAREEGAGSGGLKREGSRRDMQNTNFFLSVQNTFRCNTGTPKCYFTCDF